MRPGVSPGDTLPNGPPGIIGASGLCRVTTLTSSRLPARSIVSRNSWPIGASSTALENSSGFVIGLPSKDTMRSLTRRPASAAGLPTVKPVTTRLDAWPFGSSPGLASRGDHQTQGSHVSPGRILPGR